MALNPYLRKTLNQPSLVSNLDFLGINSSVTYDTFILSISEQTAKISKTGFTKIGHTQFPSPNGLGFQVQKLIVTNLKVGKKIFPYPYLGIFHQNHPYV